MSISTSDPTLRPILNRLRRVQGQVRGVRSMIESRQSSEAVLTQLMAVKSALNQAGVQVIGYSMKRCLAPRSDSSGEELAEEAISEFLRYRAVEQGCRTAEADLGGTTRDLGERLGHLETELHEVEELVTSPAADCATVVERIAECASLLDAVSVGVLRRSMRDYLAGSGASREQAIDEAVGLFLRYSSCVR